MFQIRKGVHHGCILSPCLFNLYADCIMQNARLDEAQAGIKIARRNINIFTYVDDTTFFFFNFILFLNLKILYWFCQILKWICHRYTRYTCVLHPEPSSLIPPHTIPLGRASAPTPSIQYRASNLDWRLVPYNILYVFKCHSSKSSHPFPLSQSPKDCSIHQYLFFCLVYRVIVTIFLNSIYMR